MKKIILSITLLILAACSTDNIEYEYPNDPAIVRKSRAGKFFKDDVTIYGKKNQKKPEEKPAPEVNSPLWIASVEVISSILPISIVDSKSGIIISEWYQGEQNKSERIKINVLVKNNQINDDSLSITLFRQKIDAKGNWQDQQTDNNLSIKLIKDRIIDKAKTLVQK